MAYMSSSLIFPCSLTTTLSPRLSKSSPSPPHFPPRRFAVSCDGGEAKIERRNLLIGGMYGAANLVYYPNSPATAEPVGGPLPPPPLDKCSIGTDLNTKQELTFNCCPPIPATESHSLYKPPPYNKPKVRLAAHLVDADYITKFEKAISAMKSLPKEDPRSFEQQANVHCAYCNLAYDQTQDSDIKLQIHKCWHFFPWHRWYLYFYERILGKLIGDPDFALPYWNWDNPPGMVMPKFFTNNKSSLYDENRDTCHYPPATADLLYAGTEPGTATSRKRMIQKNLAEMYKEMSTTDLCAFYGQEYVVGTEPEPGDGSIEHGSHTALHSWVGTRSKEGYDMGNFATAGREPIFMAHHANIDRLWSVWRNLREIENKPSVFDKAVWLDSEYLFYNEDKELVRVNVRDSLDHVKLGYTYQPAPTPWLTKPTPLARESRVDARTQKLAETIFPVKLDKVVKVLVDRPRKRRSKKEKEEEEELLEIQGIQVDSEIFVRFEVFVNIDENDKPEELIGKTEYAGCFSDLPHKKNADKTTKSKLWLGLTELLEDLELEDDDKILVALVPKAGGEAITIDSIKVIYASSS